MLPLKVARKICHLEQQKAVLGFANSKNPYLGAKSALDMNQRNLIDSYISLYMTETTQKQKLTLHLSMCRSETPTKRQEDNVLRFLKASAKN